VPGDRSVAPFSAADEARVLEFAAASRQQELENGERDGEDYLDDDQLYDPNTDPEAMRLLEDCQRQDVDMVGGAVGVEMQWPEPDHRSPMQVDLDGIATDNWPRTVGDPSRVAPGEIIPRPARRVLLSEMGGPSERPTMPSERHVLQSGRPNVPSERQGLQSERETVQERSAMLRPARPVPLPERARNNTPVSGRRGVQDLPTPGEGPILQTERLLSLASWQLGERNVERERERQSSAVAQLAAMTAERDRLLAAANQSRVTPSERYKKNPVSRPLSLSMDFSSVAQGPLEMQADSFLRRFKNWAMNEHGLERSQWVLVASGFLSGRAEQAYRSADKDGNYDMSFDTFTDLIRKLAVGTIKTGYELRDEIQDFQLVKAAAGGKPLVEAVAALETLMDKSGMPEGEKCHAIWRACPPELRQHIRYDSTSGAAAEYSDFSKMRQTILTFQGLFSDVVKGRNAPKRAAEVSSVETEAKEPRRDSYNGRGGRGSGRGNSHGRGTGRGSGRGYDLQSRQDMPRFNPEQHVGLGDRHMDWGQGLMSWVKGLTLNKIKAHRASGTCLLCKTGKHLIKDCDKEVRQKAFDDQSFFFYPAHLRRSA